MMKLPGKGRISGLCLTFGVTFGAGIGVGFGIRRFLETLPSKEEKATIYVKCPMPPKGFHGAYVDGALIGSEGSKKLGIGGYIKDHNGRFVDGFYKGLEVEGEPKNSLQAEEHAIYIGAWRCEQKGFKKVVVYSDSQTALNRVNGEGPPNNEEIARIRALRDGESFEEIKFEHMYSVANGLADAIAKKGAASGRTTLQGFSKLEDVPELTFFMRDRLEKDNFRKSYKHKVKAWKGPPKATGGVGE